MNLTPSLRRRLYDTMLDDGTLESVDDDHRLLHALASVPDGPLEVRGDYGAIANGDDDLLTPEEIVHQAADYYGIGEVGPDDPVVAYLRVTAPAGGEFPFDDHDLFQSVASSAHECYPADGQSQPTLATFEWLDVRQDVVVLDEVAPHLDPSA